MEEWTTADSDRKEGPGPTEAARTQPFQRTLRVRILEAAKAAVGVGPSLDRHRLGSQATPGGLDCQGCPPYS